MRTMKADRQRVNMATRIAAVTRIAISKPITADAATVVGFAQYHYALRNYWKTIQACALAMKMLQGDDLTWQDEAILNQIKNS